MQNACIYIPYRVRSSSISSSYRKIFVSRNAVCISFCQPIPPVLILIDFPPIQLFHSF